MSHFRILFTALALLAAGIAQAGEISERPMPMSMKDRASVAAEARQAMAANEIWDGRDATAPAGMSTATREQVRKEAAQARAMQTQTALRDWVGG